MPQIEVNPFILNDVLFQVDSAQYEAHVSQVQLTPSGGTVNWKGLTRSSVFSFAIASVWVCNLTYAQDWSSEDSLSRFLHDHEGEEVDVIFAPIADGPSIAVTLIIAAGAIGGTVDQVATSQVALGVKGRPEFVGS